MDEKLFKINQTIKSLFKNKKRGNELFALKEKGKNSSSDERSGNALSNIFKEKNKEIDDGIDIYDILFFIFIFLSAMFILYLFKN